MIRPSLFAAVALTPPPASLAPLGAMPEPAAIHAELGRAAAPEADHSAAEIADEIRLLFECGKPHERFDLSGAMLRSRCRRLTRKRQTAAREGRRQHDHALDDHSRNCTDDDPRPFR